MSVFANLLPDYISYELTVSRSRVITADSLMLASVVAESSMRGKQFWWWEQTEVHPLIEKHILPSPIMTITHPDRTWEHTSPKRPRPLLVETGAVKVHRVVHCGFEKKGSELNSVPQNSHFFTSLCKDHHNTQLWATTGQRGRPHGENYLPRHRFKNICVHTDPLTTTENAVVYIPACRWHLTFPKNREEDTDHAQKACAP